MESRTTAHYLLDSLVQAGVEYLFSNLGTDHVPLIEECARWRREGRQHPKIILCPHENVAVHMAGAYAALTGRGQAVLVHVDVGTSNAAMGLHNLCRARVPVLLMAGQAPFTSHGELPGSRDSYVHFIQEPYDLASLVRPYVKWEHGLQSGATIREVVSRAASVMHSHPRGPVFLSLPRETLMQEWDTSVVRQFAQARFGPVAAAGVDRAQVQAIAARLMAARDPIAITAYLGRSEEAVGVLDELAHACGIRVFESNPVYLNMPRDSVCFAGFEPERAIAEADLGLLLDVDVPWLPKFVGTRDTPQWLQVDIDAVKKDLPLWGFPAELRLQGDCATVLRDVLEQVRMHSTAAYRAEVALRLDRFAQAQARRRQTWDEAAADPGPTEALSAAFVCARLQRQMRDDDIVVNEAIRNAPAVLQQMTRTRPHSYFAAAGGGLGFSGGTALGARLARPGARVIQMVGDGSFHFCCPTAVYAVAQQYGLPILSVVFDNGGWKAVKDAVLRVYPDGEAAAAQEYGACLSGAQRHFEQVAQAFGAFGERVTRAEQLDAAIARAFAALESGRAAVLNVAVAEL